MGESLNLNKIVVCQTIDADIISKRSRKKNLFNVNGKRSKRSKGDLFLK